MISVWKSCLCVGAAILGLAAATCAMAAAPGKAYSYNRPCKADDLQGLWTVVDSSYYVDKSKLGSYTAPHQWYLFTSDGALRTMTSSEPNDNVGEIKKTLEKLPVVIRFMCPTPGIVETIRSDMDGASELWHASFVTEDTKSANGKVDLHKGDVVMMLMGRESRPLYVRQLRKLADAK